MTKTCPPMNPKTIQDFIMESEENLSIAEETVVALPLARYKIAEGFLSRLKGELSCKLPHWKFRRRDKFFIDSGAGYQVFKEGWGHQYNIELHFGGCGRDMKFGVDHNDDFIGERAFCPELLDSLKNDYPDACKASKWEVLIKMERPASNWQSAEMLWRMHTDKHFLAEVAGHLLIVAQRSEPIIDGLVAKYSAIAKAPTGGI